MFPVYFTALDYTEYPVSLATFSLLDKTLQGTAPVALVVPISIAFAFLPPASEDLGRYIAVLMSALIQICAF
jgi:hypothetical protein